jgi:hypothetical protein
MKKIIQLTLGAIIFCLSSCVKGWMDFPSYYTVPGGRTISCSVNDLVEKSARVNWHGENFNGSDTSAVKIYFHGDYNGIKVSLITLNGMYNSDSTFVKLDYTKPFFTIVMWENNQQISLNSISVFMKEKYWQTTTSTELGVSETPQELIITANGLAYWYGQNKLNFMSLKVIISK